MAELVHTLMENTDSTTSLFPVSFSNTISVSKTKRVLCMKLLHRQRQWNVEALPVSKLPGVLKCAWISSGNMINASVGLTVFN